MKKNKIKVSKYIREFIQNFFSKSFLVHTALTAPKTDFFFSLFYLPLRSWP